MQGAVRLRRAPADAWPLPIFLLCSPSVFEDEDEEEEEGGRGEEEEGGGRAMGGIAGAPFHPLHLNVAMATDGP